MTDTRRSAGSSRYDLALEALEEEMARPDHSAVTLIGAVAATREAALSVVLTSEVVERIDFLLRCGINRGLLAYLVVIELDALEGKEPD